MSKGQYADDQTITFTSTGSKLLRNPELLLDWKNGIPRPNSLQVALTENCQLRCAFCSVANRENKFVFEYNDLIAATQKFINLGIKTVEMSIRGDELVPIKNNSGFLRLLRIDDLVDSRERAESFTIDELNKFQQDKITDFIRHKQDEPLYKITLDGGRNITTTKSHSIFFYENDKIVAKKVSDAKIGDYVVVNTAKPSIDIVELDKDYARFLGYFVAEGSYRFQRAQVPAGLSFTFGQYDNKREKRYIDDVSLIVEKLGYNSCIYKHYNKTSININRKKLCEDVISLGIGRGARNVRVPDIIFNTTREVQIEFLKGLFGGDGGFRNTKYKNADSYRNTLYLRTASKQLQITVSYLLDMLDVEHTVSVGVSKKSMIEGRELKERTCYSVNITGRENLEKIKEVVEFVSGEIKYSDSVFSNKHTFIKRKEISKDCYGLKIKKIEEIDSSDEYVYDISVGETHRFESSFRILCHNTGGGDPLCYDQLGDYIDFCYSNNLQIGLITNGIGINKCLTTDQRNKLTWIRISTNTLDYRSHLDLPNNYAGTLGFSYCYHSESTIERLKHIRQIAIENNVEYVRLVPNCIATLEEQEENNKKLLVLATELGPPIFYQTKIFKTPANCYWGYMKPFLYPDNFVYACSSSPLNEDANQQFNPIYRWFHWTETDKIYSQPIKSCIDTNHCSHCVFSAQNEMLDYALNPQIHDRFI